VLKVPLNSNQSILKIYYVNRRHIEPKLTEGDFDRACDQSEPNWTEPQTRAPSRRHRPP